MKIVALIEDDDTIIKILKHLNLWMPYNHDPPREEITHFTINVQSHRGFEWWEALHNTSCQQNNIEDIYQTPYGDEYSQITLYED